MFRSLLLRSLRPTLLFTSLTFLGCGGLSDGTPPKPAPIDPKDQLQLTINNARGTEHTNGHLLVTVQAQKGTPDSVELLHEGEPLATLLPPFQFTWDTTVEEERVHRLQARAEWKGQVFTSEAHLVSVDRTRPAVLGFSPSYLPVPMKDATTMRASFSEPVRIVDVDRLRFEQGRDGGGFLFASPLTLSADGLTLSAPLEVPSWLPYTGAATLRLDGVVDLAGNPLRTNAEGEWVQSWTWSVPAYWSSGGGSGKCRGRPALVMDAEGIATVAFTESDAAGDSPRALEGTQIVVRRQQGDTWEPLGAPFAAEPAGEGARVSGPSLALGAEGLPVLAFLQRGSEAADAVLQVARWTSSEWQRLGVPPSPPEGARLHGATVVIDSEGRPIVALSATDGVHVARWEDDEWRPLGAVPIADPEVAVSAEAPVMSVDGTGGVFLAWTEAESPGANAGMQVRYWNGQDWEAMGGRLLRGTSDDRDWHFATEPSLATTREGRPVAVWAEKRSSVYSTYHDEVMVARWSGTAWDLSVATNTSQWISREARRWPSVHVNASGQSRVTYLWGTSSSGYKIHVTGYPDETFGSVHGDAAGLAMVVNPSGNPVLVTCSSGYSSRIHPNE
ncbi:hypothetical protein ACLEPN_33795 [Myxococcus sp. 1LA]